MFRGMRAALRRAAGTALAIVVTTIACPVAIVAQPAVAVPEIRIHLEGTHGQYDAPVRAAAQEALARYSEWLGPAPIGVVTIVERPWRGEVSDRPGQVVVDLSWWPAPAGMDVEAQVAHGVALLWWPGMLRNPEARAVAHGMAQYLQSRVVERLFDRGFFLTAYHADHVRRFGSAVPLTFQVLPLGRWTAGLGRAEFLGGGSAMTPRIALAFGTLERFIGWPALQGALRALADHAPPATTRQELVEILSDAAGQDLSWFFDAAFDGRRRFAYAVRSFSTGPAPSPCGFTPCYLTRTDVVRQGDAIFAMELLVEFSDRQRVSTRWSAQDKSRTFEFASAAPATAVRLDPDRVLLLDDNYLDNARLARSPSNLPAAKWVARWLVWLQDAMITYAF